MRYYEILEALAAAERAATKRTTAMRSFSLAQDRKTNASRSFQDKMGSIDSTDTDAAKKRTDATRKRDSATNSANAAMAVANGKLRDGQ